MNTKEKLLQRNLKTVYITLEPVAWSLEKTSDDDLEFVVRMPDVNAISTAVGSLLARSNTEHAESFLVLLAAGENAQAREQLEAWRLANNRPSRPDSEVPMFDMLKLQSDVNREILNRSMVNPTAQELGGVEFLGDLEPILLDAIMTVFKLKTTEVTMEVTLERGDAESAQMFPANDSSRVGRAGKTVRKNTVVVEQKAN
jgi:hypothetical protein